MKLVGMKIIPYWYEIHTAVFAVKCYLLAIDCAKIGINFEDTVVNGKRFRQEVLLVPQLTSADL